MDRLECQWCHAQNPVEAQVVRALRRPAGQGQPRLGLGVARGAPPAGHGEVPVLQQHVPGRGSSWCPVAEINLSPGDGVIFEHHTMLWKDESVPVGVYPMGGGLKRSLGGMPYVVTQAGGPGGSPFLVTRPARS